VILQTLEAGKTVGVVVLTNGDGYPKAAAVVLQKPQNELVPADFVQLGGTRQQQSIDGLAHLGVGVANLLFLGYPDSGLKQIYTMDKRGPYRQQLTQKKMRPVVGFLVRARRRSGWWLWWRTLRLYQSRRDTARSSCSARFTYAGTTSEKEAGDTHHDE
jgi:LmbE family N-acetylglucosaminyl deacetylase